MKLSILQEDLNKALLTVSRSVSGKSTLPILSNILFETNDGRLKLSATNLETGVNYWLGAKIEQEGSITIPARIINELVASLPAAKIDLETKETTLTINSLNYKTSMAGIDPSEFPKVPVFKGDPMAVIDKDLFIKALSQTAISVAQDEGRPVLTGVFCSFKGDKNFMVATDGYRLSLRELPVKEKNENLETLLVPGKTLTEVARIASEAVDKEGVISLGLSVEKSQIVFSFPHIDYSSRLIEGEFPDYQKIIPKESTTKAVIGREELLRSVKIASIIAREQANIIKITIDPENQPGIVLLQAETSQIGENESAIEAKTEGEKLQTAFNYRFLLEFLNTVSGSEIIFEANGPLSPGVFKSAQDPDFLHLIMPVRIQNQ